MGRGSTESIIRQLATLKQQWREGQPQYRSDYAAGKPSRFRRTRTGLGGTGDSHVADETTYFRIVEHIRDLERNEPLVRSMFSIAVNQVIQGGFRYDPKTDDEGLNTELKDWMREWCDDAGACSADGRTSFPKGEELVFRAVERDGDFVVLPLESGHLQWMECERLKTPTNSRRNIVHGVELDDTTRRAIAFYFTKGLVDPWQRITRVADTDRIPAYDEEGNLQVFHVLDEQRVTQTRGVSALIAGQDLVGMYGDVDFALLVKQQLAAFMVGQWENTTNFAGGPPPTGQPRQDLASIYGGTYGVAGGPGYAPTNGITTLEEIEPGTILNNPPGRKLTIQSSNITTSESLEHMRRIIQIVGLQVALPLIVMLMDASETNFSGWRGAVDIARMLFRVKQKNLIRRMHRPITNWRYRWQIDRGGEIGRALKKKLDAVGPEKAFRHLWHPPTWPYIQPLQDANADALKLSTLLSSPRRVAADRGLEFNDIVDETVADNKRAILTAIKESLDIYAQTKVVVHYRELLNRDLFKGAKLFDDLDYADPAQTAKPSADKVTAPSPNKTT